MYQGKEAIKYLMLSGTEKHIAKGSDGMIRIKNMDGPSNYHTKWSRVERQISLICGI